MSLHPLVRKAIRNNGTSNHVAIKASKSWQKGDTLALVPSIWTGPGYFVLTADGKRNLGWHTAKSVRQYFRKAGN